jgi:hypothetical protein
MSILDFALGLAGMPQATIDALDKDLPGLARIAAAAKEIEPTLVEMAPLIEKAWPVLVRVWPDIVAVTPSVEQLIEFVNSKDTPAD